MRTAIVGRAIDAASLGAEAAAPECGAVVTFIGTVRDHNDGRRVSGIEYAAYTAMAERELAAIAREAASRFGTPAVIIEHRVGRLAVGEASIVIVVGHAHRAAAYDASRYVIEQVKRRVPIWKREEYADGTREWVDPTRAAEAVGSETP